MATISPKETREAPKRGPIAHVFGLLLFGPFVLMIFEPKWKSYGLILWAFCLIIEITVSYNGNREGIDIDQFFYYIKTFTYAGDALVIIFWTVRLAVQRGVERAMEKSE